MTAGTTEVPSRNLPVSGAINAIEEAGREVARIWQNLTQIETKLNGLDLVTAADRLAEDLLRERLTNLGGSFLGEEEVTAAGIDPMSREMVERISSEERLWIVDPVDGTMNFAHKLEQFGISVALYERGKPKLGLVLRPITGDLWMATKGGGATRNGRPIRVSKSTELAKALTCTGFGYDRRERMDVYLEIVRRFLSNAQGLRRYGAASLDFCTLAEGGFDVYGELNLKIWDIAAGQLIVEEAGGRITTFAGNRYGAHAGSVLASNTALHEQAEALLSGILSDGVE